MTMTPEMESDLALIAQACTGPISGPAYDRFKAALSAQAKVRLTPEEIESMASDGSRTYGDKKFPHWDFNREQLHAFAARLSQGEQGEAVGEVIEVDETFGFGRKRKAKAARWKCDLPLGTKLYTQPAERAAVPDGKIAEIIGAVACNSSLAPWAVAVIEDLLTVAPQPPEGARVVPEGEFDFCTNRFTARPVTDDRYEILDKHGRVQWGRVPHEDMRMKIESGEWTVLAAPQPPEGARGVDGWQPIETAPKDGSNVLLLRGGRCVVGYWDTDRYAEKPKPYWSHDCERIFGTRDAKANPPTHWMPLPAAPTLAGKEGAE